MADVGFSENGKYFSSISQDGRLRIWDTETSVLIQEYTPDLHLTSPLTCLQWISASQSAGSSLAQSWLERTKPVTGNIIALGTRSGKILLYSVTQGKVESVLGNQHSRIVSLDWHRKYGLYSCNADSVVHEWDLEKGDARNKYSVSVASKNKSNIGTIKILPHNQQTQARFLITSSTQLNVWRLHHGQAELVKSLGHCAQPRALLALTTVDDKCWLLEGSQTERLLAFWDVTVTPDQVPLVNGDDASITPNKKKRKKSTSTPTVVHTPTYNFVLEDAPRTLDVCAKNEDDGITLSLAAATRSGVVHYYRHMLNGGASKPIKPSVTLQVSSPEAEPLPAAGCRLAGDHVLLGYARQTLMLFETVLPDLKTKTQILIRGKEKKESKKSKEKERNKEIQKEVRAEAGPDVTYVEPMGGVSRKRQAPGAKVEVPMEERLANLSVDPKARGRSAVSHNLTKLLMQGLHSKDDKLIMSVIQNNNPAVAKQTVLALPADYVPSLLERLAAVASNATSRCAPVCTWLSAVLSCHAALLLATVHGANCQQLLRLLAIFTHRRSHLCQLLNLKGRLQLTVQQRKEANDTQKEQPVLEYHDTSSESEMEVERPSDSEGEQSWEEGEEKDSGGSEGEARGDSGGEDRGESESEDSGGSDDE